MNYPDMTKIYKDYVQGKYRIYIYLYEIKVNVQI